MPEYLARFGQSLDDAAAAWFLPLGDRAEAHAVAHSAWPVSAA